ncbi:hypothetical protein AWH62_13830 [Maricaulis sp. W15]|uniref:ankyrin repeat domain-containing protein n=1 Tax=Maricaulis sp. W15 TaxID=1772333 RepID=UPI000948E035|nr:ankyrin repeat domain-containing protein [Maricaulis sp. W15]OLF80797.1 hypothetical protein AWH62_13830 [Maricaulis sp. W15]
MTLSLGQLSNQVFNACADFGSGEMPTLGLFAAAAVVDGGTSLGGYLAVKAGQSLLSDAERQRGLTLGSNHTLLSLVYRAKWSAVREIARELDADGTAKFSQNPTLKEIYGTAAYALKHPPGPKADPRDEALIGQTGFWSRVGQRLTGKRGVTRFDDSELEGFHDSDRELLRQASKVLSRETGNRPDAAAIEGFRDAAGAAAAEAVLEALQARMVRVSLTPEELRGGKEFLKRFHDPKRGWAATFRGLLKGALEDPKQDGSAKRFLLSFTAETLELTASTHALVQDLTTRVAAMQAQIQAQGVVLDQVDDGVQRLIRLAEPDLFLTRDGRETNFSANDADVAYFLDFVFTARKSEFTGRDAEFRALLEFLGPHAEACRWWQIAGDAGQGKSRLALELIDLALINNWHAGFLSWGELSSRAADWETIRIDRPTLIVVDYVAAPDKGAACARLLAQLIQRGQAGGLDWPVRVLFVERAPFRGGHTAEGGGNEALWFAPFRNNIGVFDTAAVCFNTDTALWLGPLHDDALLSIGQSWLASHELEALNEAEIERFKQLIDAREGGVLNRANRARRPLLAMVFADLIRRGDGAAEISLAGALKLALQSERTRFWEKSQSVAFKPSAAAVRLACLVNIVGTLDPARHGDVMGRRDEGYYGTSGEGWEKTFQQAWVLLGRNITEGLDGEWPAFTAREPDLFAEYFLDWSASFFPPAERHDTARRLGPIIEDAWRINPRATLEFLVRLSEDADDLGMRDVFNALAAIPLPEGADFPSLAELLPGHGDGPAERMLFASYVGLASLCHAVLAETGPSQLDACVNPAGSTVFPLLFAAQNGHGAIVAALLAEGAEANRVHEQSGNLPLLMASQNGHGAIVAALLAAGAEANRVNEQSGTFPLLMASQNGHGAIVEALLAAGAEANRVNEQSGSFPLLMASQEGHGAIVAALLAAGAEANRVNEQSGNLPLLMASQNGHGAIVEALLAAGAEANRVNEQNGTFPLLQASQNGHGAIVEALLAAGAEANQTDEQDGGFPLLLASQNGYGAIVAALLAAGAAANRVNEQNGTFPLLLASQNGHGSIVEALLAAGAEANRVNKQSGNFPLLQASQNGHGVIVEALLAAGAEAYQTDEQDGGFPLLQAAQNGHAAIVEVLLAAGAEASRVNEQTGNFPLLAAVYSRDLACVRLLVEAGADRAMRHPALGTALDYARQIEAADIIAYLESLD